MLRGLAVLKLDALAEQVVARVVAGGSEYGLHKVLLPIVRSLVQDPGPAAE